MTEFMASTEKKPVKATPPAKRPKLDKGKTMLGSKADEVHVKPVLGPRGLRECAVVAWGRMNPPTCGHERLMQIVSEVACEENADPLLFLSKRVDINNPLSYSDRLQLAEEAFGELVHVVDEAAVKDPMSLGIYLGEHYKRAIIITGEDQKDDYIRIFTTYNEEHFHLDEIRVAVIERNTESDDLVEAISATKMREFATTDQRAEFEDGLAQKLRIRSNEIFEQVAFAIKTQQILKEETKSLRDAARKAVVRARDK